MQTKKIGICKRCTKERNIISRGFCKQCYKYDLRERYPMIICNCGCGELMHSVDYHGNKIYTKRSHHTKGSRNPRWIGGLIVTHDGYIRIYKPYHIFQRYNYVYYHRLVLEQYLSIKYNMPIYILPYFDVHHKNGTSLDNRPENLEYLDKREHKQKHKAPKQ